ncbi:MAG: IdeS/Mac family cysteine endopeptidase, partial [Opitutales bacterium]|nr:IdeS/Mac family cysteine endopeptidase [Opitutales bacterium]
MRHGNSTFLHAARLTFAATALSLFTLPCFAGTKTIFAPGVTEKSGWYDVNKHSTQTSTLSDLNMCWAAVSSNMIQYWQDCYIAAGNKLPPNTPNGAGTKIYHSGRGCYELAIFEAYMDNWDLSVAGQVYMGVSWYFSGEVPNTSGSSMPISSGSGGFFSQEYASLQQLLGENFTMNSCDGYSTWGPWAEDQSRTCLSIFSERILDILEKGVGGINFNTS